jgi:hypothetical protein
MGTDALVFVPTDVDVERALRAQNSPAYSVVCSLPCAVNRDAVGILGKHMAATKPLVMKLSPLLPSSKQFGTSASARSLPTAAEATYSDFPSCGAFKVAAALRCTNLVIIRSDPAVARKPLGAIFSSWNGSSPLSATTHIGCFSFQTCKPNI